MAIAYITVTCVGRGVRLSFAGVGSDMRGRDYYGINKRRLQIENLNRSVN